MRHNTNWSFLVFLENDKTLQWAWWGLVKMDFTQKKIPKKTIIIPRKFLDKKKIYKIHIHIYIKKKCIFSFYWVPSPSLLAHFQSLHECENQNLNSIKLKLHQKKQSKERVGGRRIRKRKANKQTKKIKGM